MRKKQMRCLIVIVLVFTIFNCERSGKERNETVKPEAVKTFKGDLKVLTLNMWHEGTVVDGGFNAIAEVIHQSEADVVMLCETNNYDQTIFSDRIKKKMEALGVSYNTFHSGKSSTILSKYPIISTPPISTSSLAKCIIKLNNTIELAVYGAHLDYTHYACYLPRGYDGITWEKLPAPILSVDEILAQNKLSKRDEAIEVFVADALKEQQDGKLVVLAGDFNEPSHLDWTEATKGLFDHNGVVVPWHNSVTLQEKGYLDAYRIKYPNPVTHPGFTWAAYNKDVPLSKLTWAPEADDRDRIDFIYYNSHERFSLDDAIIVGEPDCIIRGAGAKDNTLLDKFLEPKGKWPSDHKGVLATFKIK